MSTAQKSDPLIGRLVDGRYRVRARIARGGMATVYVATDMRLERRIALKVMHGHLSDDDVFQSRFVQEARSAARLTDPHVVNVFDQGRDGDMAYLVMEYLPGVTLREVLREQRRLPVPTAVTIMDAILSGLSAAHRSGIVHRDVKPENILLAEDGRIKIGDFGLARATTANTASGQMLWGTIAYLAPELLTRGTADARSDVYALGIILYEMLTGEQPYKGEQPMQIAYQHANESVPRPSIRNPAVPEQLDELVLWATEKDPDDRPTDAGVMRDRLREIEDELGIAPQVQATLAASTTPVDDSVDSHELTAIMPTTSSIGTVSDGAPDVDNAARLQSVTRRRSARGAWVLLGVLVLAIVAGGAGWWFGNGPGSRVLVPDVAGVAVDKALSAVTASNLTPVQEQEYSLTVSEGTVIRTEPGPGARVDKESRVTLFVSQGPQPHDLGVLKGKAEADVRAALEGAGVTLREKNTYFGPEDAGTVLGVAIFPGNDNKNKKYECGDGCTVHEGDGALYALSLGPIPDVTGTSLADATATLEGVGLSVGATSEEFSDTVSAGDVIWMGDRDGGGRWRPGDAVPLTVSKGPDLVTVPDVTDMTPNDAVAALQAAGLSVQACTSVFGCDTLRVTSTDPPAGESVRRGTTVRWQAGLFISG